MCAKAIPWGNIKGSSISVLPAFFRAFPWVLFRDWCGSLMTPANGMAIAAQGGNGLRNIGYLTAPGPRTNLTRYPRHLAHQRVDADHVRAERNRAPNRAATR
jgi:hypothetical protein